MDGMIHDGVLAVLSMGMAKTILSPLERIRMKVLFNGNPSRGKYDVVLATRVIYLTEGISAFWRGNFPSILRKVPTYGLLFAFKERVLTFF